MNVNEIMLRTVFAAVVGCIVESAPAAGHSQSAAICGSPSVDVSPDRVKTSISLDMKRIGTIRPRSVKESGGGAWTIGCECLDRDYADFSKYRDYLPPLGIRTIRLQGGWAKCEKQKGIYDFRWLDEIVDWANAHGISCQLQTSYGNPLYLTGNFMGAKSIIPHEGEYFEAWKRWVDAMARHFAGRVTEWEMWNEPNNTPGNTPERIIRNSIATAEIIKRHIPDAQIAAIVLGHDDGFEPLVRTLGESGKAGLFKWATVHLYDLNPAAETGRIEKMTALLAKHAPGLVLRQGESGAVSEMVKYFGYMNLPFTEISQAKLNMMRMLVDNSYGMNTTVFTISDLHYAGRDASAGDGYAVQNNTKGLLRSNARNEIIGIKRAYYAVQNVVSVFDGSVVPIRKGGSFSNTDETVFFREWRMASGRPLVAFWQYETRRVTACPDALPEFKPVHVMPSDSFSTRPTVFEYSGSPMKEPVWVDLFSGRVFEIPAANVLVHSCGVTFIDIPVYDSPCLIAERSDLPVVMDGAR